jgi:cellulose synthase operon protein C
VVHLALSRSAMPRWFGEGLAVREQRRGRAGWGPGVSPGLLRAFADGRLPPVSALNRSFVRPSYPEEIGHAYLLASFVCDYIAELKGDEALAAMLAAWGRGLSTDEVVRTVLALEPEALDAGFDAWMRARFAPALAALGSGEGGDFRSAMVQGTALFEAGQRAEAIEPLERARALFPEYGGGDGPDWMLARIHRELGDPVREREALERLMARNEMHLEGARALGRVRREAGDAVGAARALERAIEIHPFDPALHRELAEVEEASGRADRVVAARRAVLALEPVDRAGAHYGLARALDAAGDPAAARRELLRALEIAPQWAEAQEYLLELRGRQEGR